MQRMYIRVNATPGAKKELVTQVSDDKYEISVREPAERNMANARIKTLVARELGVPESAVRMILGHQSPHKILSVTIPEPRE
jgi:uncharacterized protein YggU (UPF0235/DUF167 family)